MKRRILSIAMAAVMTLSSASTVFAAKKSAKDAMENIYEDIGGFDTIQQIREHSQTSCYLYLDTENQVTGDGCVRVEPTAQWMTIKIPAPFVVGETYDISFDYKTEGPDSTMSVYMAFNDGGNTFLSKNAPFDKGWRHHEVTWTNTGLNSNKVQTDGTGYLCVRYGAGTEKYTYYLDNFKVVPHGDVEADYSSLSLKPLPEKSSLDIDKPIEVKAVEFSDVANHWAKDTVNTLATYGYIDGIGNNAYAPEKNVTRAEFVKMIADTFNLKEREYDGAFADIEGDEWYANVVTLADAMGLVDDTMIQGGKFLPNQSITREEAASVAAKAAGLKNADKVNAKRNFTDIKSAADWAKPYINAAAEYGLIDGYSNGTYKPKAYITRAEAAQILYRVAELTTKFNIYVDAETGDDNNSGSKTSPLKSIYAAKEMVAKYNKNMRNDIVVRMRGEQYMEKALELTEEDSGFNGYRVIYTSWGDEQPTLSMGKKFKGFSMHDAKKNIYKIYVGAGTMTRQAYFNEKRGIRSRTIGGLHNPELINGDYYISDDTYLLNLAYPSEVEFKYHVHWMDPIIQVDKFEKTDDGRVKTTFNPDFWPNVKKTVNRYDSFCKWPTYFENAYEFLDAKGEWYMNSHDGYLYYIPRDGEDMSTMELLVPVGEKMITAKGSSIKKPIHGITFDNIEFADTGWLYPSVEGGVESNQTYMDKYYDGVSSTAPAPIEFTNAWYIDILNSDFTRHGAPMTLNLLGAVKYSNVTGNEFYNTSGGGVTLGDVTGVVRAKDIDEQVEYCVISNNYIHDTSSDYKGTTGVTVAWPRYTKVTHNEIMNVPYSGMHIGRGWGAHAELGTDMYEMELSHNYIAEVQNDMLYDGAHIYTLGSQSLASRENKSLWAYNYTVNNRNHRSHVYPDEGSTDWYVTKNVMDQRDVPYMDLSFDGESHDWKWTHLHVNTIKRIEYHDNYTTENDYWNNTDSAIFGETHEYPDADWPEEAQEIIKNAGIEDAYKDNFNFEGPKNFIRVQGAYTVPLNESMPIKLKVTGRYGVEYPVSDFDVNYYVADPDILKVSEDGVMTATGIGETWVMVTAEVGGRTQIKQIKVRAGEKFEKITAKTTALNMVPDYSTTIAFQAETNFGDTKDISNDLGKYTSDDTSVATIDENGTVTATGLGETTVRAYFAEYDAEFEMPVKVINYTDSTELTEEFVKVPADFTSAKKWQSGGVENGGAISVTGNPNYYKTMIDNQLIAFDMVINNPSTWPTFYFGAQQEMGSYKDDSMYMFGFKTDHIEMQRWNVGVRTMIFGNEFDPVGGPGIPNPEDAPIYEYGKKYSVIAGILKEEGGTRCILNINGKTYINYLDTDEGALPTKGFFGVYQAGTGDFTFSPYTGITD